MKYLSLVLTASLMLGAISCNQSPGEKTGISVETGTQTQEIQMEEPPPDSEQENDRKISTKNENKDWDKKIIRNVQLNVEVNDFQKYNEKVHQLIQKTEGYVADEEETGSDESLRNTLTIKVPSARFDEAVNAISGLGGKTLMKKVSSEDVTAQMFDTRTRVEAKKRIRLRYLDMLQKAKNMEEILQVEKEVNEVQEQIEAAEGRLDYLAHASSYSTIELSFFKVLVPSGNIDEPGYAKRFLIALGDGLKWVANLLIFLAGLWPLWISLLILFFVLKKVRFVSINTKN